MYIDLASPIRVDMFCRFAPKTVPDGIFSKQRITLVHLLKGEMKAAVEGRTMHLSAGDTVLLEPGKWLRPTAVKDVRYYLLQLSAKGIGMPSSTLTLDSEALDAGGSDPQMHFKMNPFLANTSHYDHIQVRMRPKNRYDGSSRFFFRVTPHTDYKMSTMVQIVLADCPADKDGFYLIDFDMSSHSLWGGTIGGLRFDPVECETVVEIDYIRFYKRVKIASASPSAAPFEDKLVYAIEFSDESDIHLFNYYHVFSHIVRDTMQNIPLPDAEFASVFFSASSRPLLLETSFPRSDNSKDVLELLLRMETQQTPERKNTLDTLARELLISLGKSEETYGVYPLKLFQIQQYIRSHYSEPLTLRILAGQFDISDSYITRLFRVHLHTTSQEYINQYRLSMACSLLVNSKLNVNEIARLVGIPNPYYFSRLFRKKMLMTPLEYRKRQNV